MAVTDWAKLANGRTESAITAAKVWIDFYQVRRAALLIDILVRKLISKKRRVLLNSFSKIDDKKHISHSYHSKG
jgi:hypothetical protein